MAEVRKKKNGGVIKGGSTYAQRLARRTRNTFRPVGQALASAGKTLLPIAKKIGSAVYDAVEPVATEALTALGDKYSMGGVNPFTAGYDFGQKVVGPALMGKGVRHHRILVKGGTLRRGVPLPHYTERTKGRISTLGLSSHLKGTANGLLHGGSFLPLGS